ncbi:MAG TPA: hypothetical protein DSN98_03590 [Thermoplasmata archaeon]|jgi:parallel beta-helix repeat protein|nr:MAG TPA: hypothetical protein DSN98_03590 [Thermoplasmata archaeon]
MNLCANFDSAHKSPHLCAKPYEGILLFYSSSNTIKRNTISRYPNCIQLIASSFNVIYKNTIMNKLIISSISTFNQITQNHIEGGVEMQGGCRSNAFRYNDISNGNRGIWLDLLCNSNSFVKNNITNNEVGVQVMPCQLNTFKRNNFINNTLHAYFEDTLLSSILPDFWWRNYWDDWDGTIPKRIEGKMIINHLSFDPDYPVPPTVKPWTNFDWFPAREPYNIPGIV